MRILILFAFICSFNVSAELDEGSLHNLKMIFAEPTAQQKMANFDMELWEQSYIDYLLQHPNVNFKTIGVSRIIKKNCFYG